MCAAISNVSFVKIGVHVLDLLAIHTYILYMQILMGEQISVNNCIRECQIFRYPYLNKI